MLRPPRRIQIEDKLQRRVIDVDHPQRAASGADGVVAPTAATCVLT
jgi:hypothetical protein